MRCWRIWSAATSGVRMVWERSVATPRAFLNPTNPQMTDVAIPLGAVAFVDMNTITGVVPAGTKLAPKPDAIKDWNALSADEKKLFARQMEVYAGFQENVRAASPRKS